MRVLLLFIAIIGFFTTSISQNIIENASFKFVSLPISSRQNYLGKAAITTFDPDIGLSLANPSLIQYNTKDKLMASSSLYFSSIYTNATLSKNYEVFDIPYVLGINMLSYGKQRQVDIDGNDMGAIYPIDMALYFAGSKTYEHYVFGLATKLVYGNYHIASKAGLTTDLSMLYKDPEREIYATLLIKNIGIQFFNKNTEAGSFPFDIQLGFSKKLKHLPFRFSVTAQEIYQWQTSTISPDYGVWPLNTYYETQELPLIDAILSHFIFAGEFNIGSAFRFGLSYDVKKGQEASFDAFRGLTGLGLGFGIYSRRYEVGYSFSKITPISASHQFTLALNLKEWLKRK